VSAFPPLLSSERERGGAVRQRLRYINKTVKHAKSQHKAEKQKQTSCSEEPENGQCQMAARARKESESAVARKSEAEPSARAERKTKHEARRTSAAISAHRIILESAREPFAPADRRYKDTNSQDTNSQDRKSQK